MPYRVTVESYSLEPGRVGQTVATLYESTHRTPQAAARRLANLIRGRTGAGAALRVPMGLGGRYTVIDPERGAMALTPFRALRCAHG